MLLVQKLPDSSMKGQLVPIQPCDEKRNRVGPNLRNSAPSRLQLIKVLGSGWGVQVCRGLNAKRGNPFAERFPLIRRLVR
jgi:hypothetical protein